MIGLNPWRLVRNKFCFIWLDSGNCSLEDVLVRGRNIKGGRIRKAYILKAAEGERGKLRLVGKWDKRWSEGYEPIGEMMKFLEDSYLVALYGDRYVFRMIDECLGVRRMNPLDRNYAMDVEEVFGWVYDREWADSRVNELKEMYGRCPDGGESTRGMMEWFGENMLPLLKNGFK